MLNQVVSEAIISAKYVDHYLDAVENLPDEIQRFITRIRELDVKYRSEYSLFWFGFVSAFSRILAPNLVNITQDLLLTCLFDFPLGCLRDVDYFYEQWANCPTSELEGANATKRNRAMTRIQQSLIAAQELGDEKLQIVQQLTDLIEVKTRQLDQDYKNLDYGKEEVIAEVVVKDNRSVSPVLISPTSTSAAPVSFVPTTPNPPAATAPTGNTSSVNGNNGNGGSVAVTSSGSGGGSERGTKRARRARTDTGSGMDVDNSDSNTKTETSVKQAQTSTQKKVASSSGSAGASSSTNTTSAAAAAANNNNNSNKKKRKKSGRSSQANSSRDARDDTPPLEEAIDPDEPTYCLCDQISFGEMILCDNDLCPIEWFHFSCVSLMTKPKGKWYCPNCRGDRPNVMKPKAQFLKELERYNKEKEEKT